MQTMQKPLALLPSSTTVHGALANSSRQSLPPGKALDCSSSTTLGLQRRILCVHAKFDHTHTSLSVPFILVHYILITHEYKLMVCIASSSRREARRETYADSALISINILASCCPLNTTSTSYADCALFLFYSSSFSKKICNSFHLSLNKKGICRVAWLVEKAGRPWKDWEIRSWDEFCVPLL